MSSSSFEINGLTRFEQDLIRTINQRYPNEAKKFMRQQANDVRREARRNTPKDTGYTRGHWKVSTKGKRTVTANFIESKVTNNAELSHLLENGHKIKNEPNGPVFGFVPGYHMLENAVTAKEAEFDRELNSFINNALEVLRL